MEVVAIKFKDGTYYSGCNKNNSQTLLGAQLYKSEKTAEKMMETSINFKLHESHNEPTIVKVLLTEI